MPSTIAIQRTFTTQAESSDQLKVTFTALNPTGLATASIFVFQTGTKDIEKNFICVATLAQLDEIPAFPTEDQYGPVDQPVGLVVTTTSSGTSIYVATPNPAGPTVDGEEALASCAACNKNGAPIGPTSVAYVRKTDVTFVIRRRDDADAIGAELMDRINKLLRELDAQIDPDATTTFQCDGESSTVLP